MRTTEDIARTELEKELQDKLDTYIRLAEVSRRTIKIEQQQIENYEAQISVLRETLQGLKSPRSEETRIGSVRNLLQSLKGA